MKSGRVHEVPLPLRCIELLAIARQRTGTVSPSAIVFPNPRGRRFDENVLKDHVGRIGTPLGHADITLHGFRSTFRDWAGDATHHDQETIEMCLAHVVKDATEAAYRRSSALEKRRRVLEDYANYCASESR